MGGRSMKKYLEPYVRYMNIYTCAAIVYASDILASATSMQAIFAHSYKHVHVMSLHIYIYIYVQLVHANDILAIYTYTHIHIYTDIYIYIYKRVSLACTSNIYIYIYIYIQAIFARMHSAIYYKRVSLVWLCYKRFSLACTFPAERFSLVHDEQFQLYKYIYTRRHFQPYLFLQSLSIS